MGLITPVLRALGALLDQLDRMYPPPPGVRLSDGWEGPDDTWPKEQITETPSESELIVTGQYGLQMPNGEIIWNSWPDPPMRFDNVLDRLRMVATLQKTAVDVGFETEEFLSRYGWVTRNQIATVVYEDTGSYSLTDPEICGVSLNGEAQEKEG